MVDWIDQILTFIMWAGLVLAYLFCAFSVTLTMLTDKVPPMIVINGQDPNKPVGKLGAILHGLFWPIVFTIKLLTKEKKDGN